MNYRPARFAGVLVSLFLASALIGCDAIADQGTQIQPTASQPQQQTESQAQASLPASQQPAASTAPSAAGGVGTEAAVEQVPAQQQGALSEYESIVNQVYENTIGSVVSLTDGQVSGSGFVIDEQGHIVTNNHVIEPMQQIFVSFNDGSSAEARLVGTFPEGDIAVVQVDALPEGMRPAALGDSGALRVGQIVVAIGSPLRLQETVTSGIVSALNRSVEDLGEINTDSSLYGLIQTDASINPGNSGGPLFDKNGTVIGMNTLIASLNEGSVGLGFAVPVNRIKHVVPQLIERGEYRRPLLGIGVRSLTDQIGAQVAAELNLPRGVMIANVDAGSPAEQAGLRGATEGIDLGNGEQFPTNGDIIVGINGKPVEGFGDLRNILETESDPGDTITVTILRDGQEQETQLTLGG